MRTHTFFPHRQAPTQTLKYQRLLHSGSFLSCAHTHPPRLVLAPQMPRTHSQLQALLPGPTSIQVSTGPQLRLLSTSPDRVSRYCSSSGTSIWGQVVRVGYVRRPRPRQPTALLYCPSSPLAELKFNLYAWALLRSLLSTEMLSYQLVKQTMPSPPQWCAPTGLAILTLPWNPRELPMILQLKGVSRALLQF